MTTEQSYKEVSYLEYIQRLHTIGTSIINGELKWSSEKKQLILNMKDVYLDMINKGYYEKDKSCICSDICQILKSHDADENAFAYVRMVLPSEFKDQTKTTFDNIINRAFRQNKDEIDKDKINLLEPLNARDFDGLTKEEKELYKKEYKDVIKESKRRIRDNNQILDIVTEEIQIDNGMVTGKFPQMNEKIKSILLELRTIIKNAKRLNHILNDEADKPSVNQNFDFNLELNSILNNAKLLNSETNRLLGKLNK